MERRNPISSNCANELNKLLVEQPTTEKKKKASIALIMEMIQGKVERKK